MDGTSENLETSEIIERYAELVVTVGAGVEPGTLVQINSPLEGAEFVAALASAAYAAGGRYVDVRYVDEAVRRALVERAPEEALGWTPPWLLARLASLEADEGALINVTCPGERVLPNAPPERVMRAGPKELGKRYFAAVTARSISDVTVSVPTSKQASSVFGEPDIGRLWESFAHCLRLNEREPLRAWREHLERLRRRCNTLNSLQLRAFRFFGGGTELTVGLLPRSRWLNAAETTRGGRHYVANLPTEEVFTCPDRNSAEGVVRATRPLLLEGAVVRDLVLEFHAGKIIAARASTGNDQVLAQLDADEGARRLGELALVDEQSRVGQTGLVFFDPLFDENAVSHLAWGAGVAFALEGEGSPATEAAESGINVSSIHTDFMIGGPEIAVDGIDANGRAIALLRENAWRLEAGS